MSYSPYFSPNPNDVHIDTNYSNLPMISMRATALEVCYSVYGENATSLDAVDRFYEANAGKPLPSFSVRLPYLTILTTLFSHYQNPFVTATSRSVISDIHRLARQLSSIDVPRPLAVIFTLFGLQPPRREGFIDEPLFQALRVWNEIGDICECESFDGHRKTIVEHTLNILFLPGIHHDGLNRHKLHGSTESLVNPVTGSPVSPIPHLALPSLPVPGTSLSIPSPLHFKLRILTRLSFNEQGCVTHHRDFWDVKDVMGLVPGVSLTQWVVTRLAAAGLSYAARLLPKRRAQTFATHASENMLPILDLGRGFPSPERFSALPTNALGLEGM
ncbi:hypothetical protein AX17_002083 [Amanita inopinata Kibby_2008]|nr:hypothetical protein AX17_002083 [Amanita inopinata Kibby_2008]